MEKQHQAFIDSMLEEMIAKQASDVYLTVGRPPCFRIDQKIIPLETLPLSQDNIVKIIHFILGEERTREFAMALEYDYAYHWRKNYRFRLNCYQQKNQWAMVIRRIHNIIPTIEGLGLSSFYADLVMKAQGLILITGSSGAGKSSSVAAMIDHRNRHSTGHIITIEDPIEFVHEHQGCIVTQREVGIDTLTYHMALRNALRQRADVVMIGEIRDRESMEYALNFAKTGHLCIATMHASNVDQTIHRIVDFFPEEMHKHILTNVAQSLIAILAQKMLTDTNDTSIIATEVMLNTGIFTTLIAEGRILELKEHMDKQHDARIHTFDQYLLELYQQQRITEEMALQTAENRSALKLKILQYNKNIKGGQPSN